MLTTDYTDYTDEDKCFNAKTQRRKPPEEWPQKGTKSQKLHAWYERLL